MSVRNGCLLGIDIGTSGLKCVLVDGDGLVQDQRLPRLRAKHTASRLGRTRSGNMGRCGAVRRERDVDRAGVSRASIAGLGFSGQMHSTVCLDKDGRCLRPAILWLDHRSAAQVAALREQIGTPQLAEWIGNPIMPGFMLASLLWLKESEPATWDRLAHVLLPKDYVRFRLTGEFGTDYSDASSTALLNVRQRAWCRRVAARRRNPRRYLAAPV